MSAELVRTAVPPPDPSREVKVAEQLWARAEREVNAAGDLAGTVDVLLTIVDAGLRRWIGAEGYAVLLSRAVAATLPTAPALMSVADVIDAVPEDTTTVSYTSQETKAAVVALLVTMMRQLGGIIGDDMAIRLVELSGKPSPRGNAGAETNDTSS